jgi:flagellar biosynthesis chaperone FliJ
VVSALLLQLALLAGVFKAAYDKGFAAAQIENQQSQIDQLATVIGNTQTLVNYAESVSERIQQTLSSHQVADQKTTQEIHRALSQTASTRIDCKFDDVVMQQLTAARDRANQAATAGIGYPLPASITTD